MLAQVQRTGSDAAGAAGALERRCCVEGSKLHGGYLEMRRVYLREVQAAVFEGSKRVTRKTAADLVSEMQPEGWSESKGSQV